ncbi:hypothetical protein MO987_23090 [Vibrio vulnificus]|nr:hypothetical protein [Vibrio vulnificus]
MIFGVKVVCGRLA